MKNNTTKSFTSSKYSIAKDCYFALRKCQFDPADSLILSFGDDILSIDSPEVIDLVTLIMRDEQKIHNSRDSLEIQLYRMDLELSVCMLKNVLNQMIKEDL